MYLTEKGPPMRALWFVPFALLVACCVRSPALAAYAPQPLPAGSDAHLGSALDPQEHAAAWRDIAEAYSTVGVKDSKWDEAAVRYLKNGIAWLEGWPNSPTTEAQLKDGQALLDLGCTDPMVCYFHGRALWKADRTEEAGPWLIRAADGVKAVRYPRRTAYLAAVSLGRWYLQARPDDKAAAEKMRVLATQWAAEAAGEVKSGEQRLVLQWLRSGWDDLFDKQWPAVAEAVRNNPKADPWIVEMMAGRAIRNRAWQHRGGGYADTVTEAGWAGFEKYLPEARTHFTKAWELHPEFPEAATEMIEVATADASEQGESRRWFDRAVTAQLDYLPAYHQYLFYTRPRWGGTHEAMYDFGLDCLKTARYDTQVPLEYLQILSDIDDELYEQSPWWKKPEVYENLKQMCEGLYPRRNRTRRRPRPTQQHLPARHRRLALRSLRRCPRRGPRNCCRKTRKFQTPSTTGSRSLASSPSNSAISSPELTGRRRGRPSSFLGRAIFRARWPPTRSCSPRSRTAVPSIISPTTCPR